MASPLSHDFYNPWQTERQVAICCEIPRLICKARYCGGRCNKTPSVLCSICLLWEDKYPPARPGWINQSVGSEGSLCSVHRDDSVAGWGHENHSSQFRFANCIPGSSNRPQEIPLYDNMESCSNAEILLFQRCLDHLKSGLMGHI